MFVFLTYATENNGNRSTFLTQVAPFGVLYARVGERMYVDLDDYVLGFNTTHYLSPSSPNFAFVQRKIDEINSETLSGSNGSLPEIVSQYYPRDRLNYLNESEPLLFLTKDRKVYNESANSTHLNILNNSSFTVTENNDTTCFGVTYINGLIIVDCMVVYEEQQINQFFIFNVNNFSDNSSIPSSTSCKTNATGRTERGIKAFAFGNGSTYLYRYQKSGSSCMDCLSKGAVEIWRFDGGHDLVLLNEITSILSKGIQLRGFSLYLGELFLLSAEGYVCRISNYQKFGHFDTRFVRVIEFSDDLLGLFVIQELLLERRILSVVVASTTSLHVLDWSDTQNPFTVTRYRLDQPNTIKDVLISRGFIYCLARYGSNTDTITIFRRRRHLREYIFGYIEVKSQHESYLEVDAISDYLVVSSGNTISRYYTQYSYLWLGNPSTEDHGIITLSSFSCNVTQCDYFENNITYYIVDEHDYNSYYINSQASHSINTEYPSSIQQDLDYLVAGPFTKYKIDESLTSKTLASVKSYLPIGFNLEGFDTSGIIFHSIFSPENPESDRTTSTDTVWLFIQNRTMFLTAFSCYLDLSMSLNCKRYEHIYIDDKIVEMEIIQDFIFILQRNKKLSLASTTMIMLNDTLAEGCTDLVPVSRTNDSLIICMQPDFNRIAYFQYADNKLEPSRYITEDHFSMEVSLVSMDVELIFPSIIFINNNNTEILVVDVELLTDYDTIVVLDIIDTFR